MQVDINAAKKVLEKNGYKFIKKLGSGNNTSFYECKKGDQRLAVKFQLGDSTDKEAEDYLNKQKYNWFKTLSFEEAVQNKNSWNSWFGKIFDFDRYYKYINLPKAIEKDIAEDLKEEGVKIEPNEKVYISEALLADNTVHNYLFKKVKDRWVKDFKKRNKGNVKLLEHLDQILKTHPNDLPKDLEEKMNDFAKKNNLTVSKASSKSEQTAEEKNTLVKKAVHKLYPILSGGIKGLSVLHSKNRAHMDLHMGNLYLKKVGKKVKVQVADFDRMVSAKGAKEHYDMKIEDAMCEDIKNVFKNCVSNIIEELYRLNITDMPKSFRTLFTKVQGNGYSNAEKLLRDPLYKSAIAELKQMSKEYETYKSKKTK